MSDLHPRTPKTRPLFGVLLALGIALLVGWLLFVTLAILEQSEQNGRIASDAATTARTLEDCVRPGGKCFEDGQARTGEAVSGINEATLRIGVAVAVCYAQGEQGERELLSCATQLLERSAEQQ